MIITANPSTLVEFARRADREKESLIRDIHDGTLSCDVPQELRQALARRILRRRPERARELDRIVARARRARCRSYAWPRTVGAGRVDRRLGQRLSVAAAGAVRRRRRSATTASRRAKAG